MRQIFLDTETTGLAAEAGDRVIEIGCIEMINRRMTGRNLHLYLNPERASHPDALKVHGLTDEFLADKPRFGQIAAELIDYLHDAELIIHNAAFDIGFLDAELRRLGQGPMTQIVAKVTDSLTIAREAFPGKSNSLDALCRRLEVDNSHRHLHGALLDAGLLAEVYIRLTRGQDLLVIEEHANAADHEAHLGAVDLTDYVLPVLEPTPEEIARHDSLLAELDKASGNKTLWRQQVLAGGMA